MSDRRDGEDQVRDHDVLVGMAKDVKYIADNMGRLTDKFEAHEGKDDERFDRLNKFMWMGLGALAALDIVLRVIKG